MKALLAGLAAAGLTASLVAAPIEARAGDGGAVAAGIIGGLAAGAIIGSAVRPPVVYAPAPRYGTPTAPPGCGRRCRCVISLQDDDGRTPPRHPYLTFIATITVISARVTASDVISGQSIRARP
jgi:hypothetical protein